MTHEGRLSTVNYNGKPLTHYTYAVSGEMQRSVRGPITSEYTYNTLGQLSAYQTQVMNDQGKQIATLNYAFSYAPDGNLLVRKKSGSSGTATEHYAYDAVDNLQDYTFVKGPLAREIRSATQLTVSIIRLMTGTISHRW